MNLRVTTMTETVIDDLPLHYKPVVCPLLLSSALWDDHTPMPFHPMSFEK
jgi:hypothetical protein